MKNVLIVGGTSGLGRELALKFFEAGHCVTVTGRSMLCDELFSLTAGPTRKETIHVVGGFNLTHSNTDRIGSFIRDNFEAGKVVIDIFVYAPGFYQEGTMGELNGTEIDDMLSVGLRAPAFFLRHIFAHQKNLPGFIAITSTSQWTPRLEEPVYTAVKAGLYMLANSVSLDERVGKVLVAAPAGMDTPFWRNRKKAELQDANLLDPKWVAEKVVGLYKNKHDIFGSHFEFRFAKILRNPPRVKIEETRYSNK